MVDTTSNQVRIRQWIDCGCKRRYAFVAVVDTPM